MNFTAHVTGGKALLIGPTQFQQGAQGATAAALGMKPEDVVFSGVGKTRAELEQALDVGIGQFNIELEEEGVVLAQIAASKGKTAVATLRVNPDVDAGTHAKISTGKKENKFGVAIDLAPGIFDRLAGRAGLSMQGVALHIGSQLFDLDPLEAAYGRIGQLVAELRGMGHKIGRVDLGGGLGDVDLHAHGCVLGLCSHCSSRHGQRSQRHHELVHFSDPCVE
jgi:diaminopimelate decarboxylase